MTLSHIISNAPVENGNLQKAAEIILGLQEELKTYIAQGAGPFLAAIYDDKYNLIAKAANSVVSSQCSNCHAEINVLQQAEAKLHTFDLAPHHLRLYVTAEPCLMCLGAIMWSGIETIYYGVPSKRVEEITGFDEGFKPGWLDAFKKRGITVYGNIEPQAGENMLEEYVRTGHKIYKPSR